MYSHKHCARTITGTAIHAAIRKYGFESFLIEEVFFGSFSECLAKEVRLIQEENTRAPFGYNLTNGGEGSPGVTQTRESIEKRSKSNKGKKRSAAFSARMSELHKGKQVSEETKQRQREAARKRVSDPAELARLKLIGTNHSKRTFEKISDPIIKSESTITKIAASETQPFRQKFIIPSLNTLFRPAFIFIF